MREKIDKVLDILGVNIEKSYYEIERFFNSIGISISIIKLIDKFDKNIIINNVNTERLSNNPRKITKEIIKNIFE